MFSGDWCRALSLETGVQHARTTGRDNLFAMPPLDQRREAAIADFLKRLRAVLGGHLVDVRLFGSVARGDARPDSDIDILVVVQPDDERARLERVAVDTAFDLNLQHDVYISPRVLTPGILADPIWGQTPFLKAVQRESVAL